MGNLNRGYLIGSMLEPRRAAVFDFAQTPRKIATQLLYLKFCVDVLSAVLEEDSQPHFFCIQTSFPRKVHDLETFADPNYNCLL